MTNNTVSTAVRMPYNPNAVAGAVALWAQSSTSAGSARRGDLVRDKGKAVMDFFDFTGKHPGLVTPIDVSTWQGELEARAGKDGTLSPSTVYARVCQVSSFYDWAAKDPDLARVIHGNPTRLVHPTAPKPYANQSAKPLDADELKALVQVVRDKADGGSVIGKRDYALMLFYLLTGMRRREVAQLRWGDLRENEGALVVTCEVKGGEYVTREIKDARVYGALLDYLRASGRLEKMDDNSPLWTRHDRAGNPGDALTTHAIAKRFKAYARQAGIKHFHLHQFRHTFAGIVANQAGSIMETQEALGHQKTETTRVYVNRITVKRDRWSGMVAEEIGL